MNSATAPLTKWILIAGPYRSGTGDHPELLARNVAFMESFALPIFRAGHVPVLGEWLALPLVHAAGSQRVGDEAFNEIFHPVASRLLDKCDGVLRVGGPSVGADEMVRIARERGLDIYSALDEIPGCGAPVSDQSPIDAGTHRKCRRIPETGLECRIHIGHGEIRAELYGQRISYVRIQDGSRQDAAHRRTFIAA